MKKVGGYARYTDDPTYVGCPRATTDMTPCVARDGSLSARPRNARPGFCSNCGGELDSEGWCAGYCTMDDVHPGFCVGCDESIVSLIGHLENETEVEVTPADGDGLRDTIRTLTESEATS